MWHRDADKHKYEHKLAQPIAGMRSDCIFVQYCVWRKRETRFFCAGAAGCERQAGLQRRQSD